MREIYVEVEGLAIAQGSMRAMTNKAGRPYVMHADKNLKPWRDKVSEALRREHRGGEGMSGAVEAYFAFVLPKPASVKRDRPHVRPDLDKLVRAILDACTASGVINDDGQVCKLNACKVYCFPGQEPKAKIFLKELS